MAPAAPRLTNALRALAGSDTVDLNGIDWRAALAARKAKAGQSWPGLCALFRKSNKDKVGATMWHFVHGCSE